MRYDRREFLTLLAGALTPAAVLRPLAAATAPPSGGAGHPDPRPGVDASRVLPADQVPPHLAELYDGVREIPHIVDGIRCQCGCDEVDSMYSLLSCYEASGMAQYCDICQAEGRLVVRLHAEGRTLDEIRTAVTRRFD